MVEGFGGYIGSGTIFIKREGSDGWTEIGNVTDFKINETEADTKERISRMVGTYGQALDTQRITKPPKISMTVDTLDPDNMAMALRGIVEKIERKAGSKSDIEITAVKGAYVELEDKFVKNVTVTSNDGTTTYEKGKDYKVNETLGLIKILEDGSITDGEALKVSYDYGVATFYKIKGSKQAQISCALKVESRNEVNGKELTIEIFKAVISPAKEVSFITEDFNSIDLEGTIITPEGKDTGYIVTMRG